MEQTLSATAMKIVAFVNTHKDHIPPITTQGTNPFPYKINIDQKEAAGWVYTRMMSSEESHAPRSLRVCGAYIASTLLYLYRNSFLWDTVNGGFVE
jgi:hypothetical protein